MPSSHEARSVPWRFCCVGTLEYHTNPCVQIVTDAALINSTMQRAGYGGYNATGYSAGVPAGERPLCPLRHSSNRCTTAKNGGTNSTATQVDAIIPVNTVMPIDTRALAPAPLASTSGTTPRMKASEVITIGRKRERAASVAASKTYGRRSASRDLAQRRYDPAFESGSRF